MTALIVITLVALAWRIGYAVVFKWDQLVTGDAYFYHHQANGLSTASASTASCPHGVQQLVPERSGCRPPPALLAVPGRVLAVRRAQLPRPHDRVVPARRGRRCSCAAPRARGRGAARRASSPRSIAAVYANLWIQDPFVTSESITMLMVAVAVLTAYRLWRAPSVGRATWFGVACGLAALTRAEVILFLPLVLIPLVLSKREWTKGLRPRVFVVERRGRDPGDVAVARSATCSRSTIRSSSPAAATSRSPAPTATPPITATASAGGARSVTGRTPTRRGTPRRRPGTGASARSTTSTTTSGASPWCSRRASAACGTCSTRARRSAS